MKTLRRTSSVSDVPLRPFGNCPNILFIELDVSVLIRQLAFNLLQIVVSVF